MPIEYNFYCISFGDGDNLYFKTKKAAETWLKEEGYRLADPCIWDHVYTKEKDEDDEGHIFLLGKIFEETFEAYKPTWIDRLIAVFYAR